MEKTLATFQSKRSSPSPSTVGFNRRTKARLSDATTTSVSETSLEDDDDEEEEDEGVEEKIEALQSIVPGGTELGVDALFEETASYILALQSQINAIKVLTSFLERCEKDDMKFGG